MNILKTVESDSPEEFIEEIGKIQNALPKRIDANPENVEKGLAKLVLTLIELEYARDHMHAGPRGHQLLAERIIHDWHETKTA